MDLVPIVYIFGYLEIHLISKGITILRFSLNDTTRWKLEVRDNRRNEDWGFKLTLLEEGTYSYDSFSIFPSVIWCWMSLNLAASLQGADGYWAFWEGISGEYQLISRMRFHNTTTEVNNNVTTKYDGYHSIHYCIHHRYC